MPNKQRRIANRTKVQKRKAQAGVTKNARGTRKSAVLYPTSGPLAPVSGKKARKLEKAANHVRQRAIGKALEADREVEMTGRLLRIVGDLDQTNLETVDAPETTKKHKTQGDKMEVDDMARI